MARAKLTWLAMDDLERASILATIFSIIVILGLAGLLLGVW